MSPAKSIHPARVPLPDRPRIRARSFPKLDHVWIRAWCWPGGDKDVWDVYETREECGPDTDPASDPHNHTCYVATRYPGEVSFRWKDLWFATPAGHFLKEFSFQQAGSIAARARAELGAEVILCDYSVPIPATDLRASLQSGLHGPAPLPAGIPWPECPACHRPHVFVESIDFRDVTFAHLLPGTSLVIFMCEGCLDTTALFWLPPDQDVVLVTNGAAEPLLEARQWLDDDFPDMDEIPESFEAEVQSEWPGGLPCSGVPRPHTGTKAGGFPRYIQATPTLLDKAGCHMEFIGHFTPPQSIMADSGGFLFHSTTTGETTAVIQYY